MTAWRMRNAGLVLTISLVTALWTGQGRGDPPAAPLGSSVEGDRHFALGEFEAARAAYEDALKEAPADPHLLSRMGEIALLSNRLDEAEEFLSRAVQAGDDDSRPTALLAETYYRRDDFRRAASLFRESGRNAMAAKLERLAEKAPYRTRGEDKETHIPFALTDPLPVVRGRVNGGEPVNLLIDTGGGEVILDPEFAETAGAARFGSESGTFGGDKKANFEHGSIDSLQLGDFTIENVPVHLLSTRRFAAAAGGMRIDGIIGTVLFYHFVATLDYPGGELVLRRLENGGAPAPHTASGDIEVPIHLAGDHLILARGRANRSDPMLMLVDTGLAGGGFTCPESTIRAASIKLPEQQFEGVGGGGTIKVTPFVIDELSLGEAKRNNIASFFGPFPESLENGRGFRIGGLVSHAFFRPYSVTFDFREMKIRLATKR